MNKLSSAQQNVLDMMKEEWFLVEEQYGREGPFHWRRTMPFRMPFEHMGCSMRNIRQTLKSLKQKNLIVADVYPMQRLNGKTKKTKCWYLTP